MDRVDGQDLKSRPDWINNYDIVIIVLPRAICNNNSLPIRRL
jgi:hypothetical protein